MLPAQANTGALLRYVNMGAPTPRPFSTWQLVSPTPRRCEMNPAKNEAFSFIQGPGEPSFAAHVDKPGRGALSSWLGLQRIASYRIFFVNSRLRRSL